MIENERIDASHIPSLVDVDDDHTFNETKKKKISNKSEAIGIKYSKWQTDILMAGMIDHKDNDRIESNPNR
jgi:hypothetical protein